MVGLLRSSDVDGVLGESVRGKCTCVVGCAICGWLGWMARSLVGFMRTSGLVD